MADLTKRIICIVLYWISQMQLISAEEPYCEWGICGSNEFCCRPNECCPQTSGTVFIVLWILGGVIGALIAFCIYKYKYYICRMFSSHPEGKPFVAQQQPC